ncbi:TnsA endonuclease N-terminal domain-containing protein [Psychrobacillus glaciei]|nr:DDE-type integrase/transposase/recombinase [Psychrobacillus glaciei]
MGVTIQFESHKVELPTIYMLEFNDSVLEYYDQPPQIKLLYYQSNKNNRKRAYLNTPDFFVIEKERAYWIECKTEEELIRKSQENPERFYKLDGNWIFAPGKTYADEFNLEFLVNSSEDINWILQRNLIFLGDYIVNEYVPEDSITIKIKEVIKTKLGLTLSEILQISEENFILDDIYALIANNTIYFDIYKDLITEPENVKVFLNKEQYTGFKIMEKSNRKIIKPNRIELKSGNKILWGQTEWTILNYDQNSKIVFLYSKHEKKNVELPINIFESYLSEGFIKAIKKESNSDNIELKKMISMVNEDDLKEANNKYEIVSKYLRGEELEDFSLTDRTLRNWVKKFKDAEELHGHGFIGLLPQIKKRGNRNSKLSPKTKDLMETVIMESYATIKSKTAKEVYRELLVKCEELNYLAPSYATLCTEIKNLSVYEIEMARKGKRAAYKYEKFVTDLHFTSPKHGERIFEIAHIDHTELDIELDINGKVSKRPWLTFMIDAYSRRILAFYLTFEEPSYRSCMMVIRECVKSFNRLPNYVVVDGGKEFESIYFESLLAMYGVHKKQRPAAKARYGNVIERLFGITNKLFIHNLRGNTQITKNVRQVTKSVNPKNHAVWTLDTLYERLDSWIKDVYDNMENPSLNKTPHDMFEESSFISGNRPNTYIPYDETFVLMTLPSPKGKTRKVHPGQGIKLTYSYYWSKKFRNPKIENEHVEVKYDPFNIGVSYAFIENEWVECLSEQFKYLNGKTEKQIKLLAEEIRQKNKLYSRSNTVTAIMLAKYIIESEEIEENIAINKYKPLEKDVRKIESPKEISQEIEFEKEEYDDDLELDIFGELV